MPNNHSTYMLLFFDIKDLAHNAPEKDVASRYSYEKLNGIYYPVKRIDVDDLDQYIRGFLDDAVETKYKDYSLDELPRDVFRDDALEKVDWLIELHNQLSPEEKKDPLRMEGFYELSVKLPTGERSKNSILQKIYGEFLVLSKSAFGRVLNPFTFSVPTEWPGIDEHMMAVSRAFPEYIIRIDCTGQDNPAGIVTLQAKNGEFEWLDWEMERSKFELRIPDVYVKTPEEFVRIAIKKSDDKREEVGYLTLTKCTLNEAIATVTQFVHSLNLSPIIKGKCTSINIHERAINQAI